MSYESRGEHVTLTAPPGGVVHHRVYVIGALVVVALDTRAAGERFVGATSGMFQLAKVSTEEWTEGASVYWDVIAALVTTEPSGNTLLGVAAAVAVNPSARGLVLLGAIGTAGAA